LFLVERVFGGFPSLVRLELLFSFTLLLFTRRNTKDEIPSLLCAVKEMQIKTLKNILAGDFFALECNTIYEY
jgi:hypothetical protein